jgi:hypothetical protein
VNGNQSDNSASQSGAAYVFTAPAIARPELRLSAARNGDLLQLTATGTTNTQWRIEYRDTVTGTNVWQPFTNITLGPFDQVRAGPLDGPGAGASLTVIQQPLTSTNRFYRGAWVP